MARTPVQAAGGIVLRQARPPLIAVVRLRKRNEWVLPKGKLDDGETPRDAAEREVNEETGHDVIVHEFLGTLVYESSGRSKIVHYWRMQADGDQVYELMTDIREVDWLPLEVALVRLSRASERAFLENVGPVAVAAAIADMSKRKPKAAQRPRPCRRKSVARRRLRRQSLCPRRRSRCPPQLYRFNSPGRRPRQSNCARSRRKCLPSSQAMSRRARRRPKRRSRSRSKREHRCRSINRSRCTPPNRMSLMRPRASRRRSSWPRSIRLRLMRQRRRLIPHQATVPKRARSNPAASRSPRSCGIGWAARREPNISMSPILI
jgi:8-oxo-dGTP diphosphatase